MAVQQQHGRTGPAVADLEHGFADADIAKGEATEPVRCHRNLTSCWLSGQPAECDQLTPPQKQDDKHDDHDENNCSKSDEHRFPF